MTSCLRIKQCYTAFWYFLIARLAWNWLKETKEIEKKILFKLVEKGPISSARQISDFSVSITSTFNSETRYFSKFVSPPLNESKNFFFYSMIILEG